MSLYVIPVPDPDPGIDWLYTVPGQYLEDITAITATFTAPTIGGFPDCPDAAGNNNDATYSAGGSTFVPGLIPGDNALQRNAGNGDQINTTHPIVDVSSAFTFTEWIELDAAGPDDLVLGIYADSALGFTGWNLIIPQGFPNRFFLIGVKNGAGGATIFETANGTVPYDSAPHMLTVTFDPAASPQNNLYLDGVLIPWNVTDVPFFYNGPSAGWHFNIGYSPKVTDEIAIFPGVLTGGEIAGLYAARSSFVAYYLAVFALNPIVYYHLNGDTTLGTPVETDLVVTDGTDTVLEIPTGFGLPTAAGPWSYSWQPNLNSSTQTAGGTTTTVAIPRLLLPAGYTVGSRSFDQQSTAQWSNVNIWWDDTYQHSLDPRTRYAYPPGATYRRQPSGTP